MSKIIAISHKIEIKPNNKQKTYFRKAFGCARFSYNWGLDEWKRRYKAGEKVSSYELNNAFNAIKREQFPFVLEVTKYATQAPFINLGKAYKKFFEDLKRGIVSYPKYKRKLDNEGSFYIGGDMVKLSYQNNNSKVFNNMVHNVNQKHQYLQVPKLGWVKMTQRLRFNGHINSVTISQKGDRFFASFSVMITEEEYRRTHPSIQGNNTNRIVGIDLGIKSAMILSDGISVENPKPLKNELKSIKRMGRQLDKRTHARTKQERIAKVQKSNNYKKLAVRLANRHRHVANIRTDFSNKVTSIITSFYSGIGMENLNVKGMTANHHLAQAILDVSFGELRTMIECKSSLNATKITFADRFYPSSKTCSKCGNVKSDLHLKDRVYHCDRCGTVLDRDYNAALNLRGLVYKQQIGTDYPELTPADLSALLYRFQVNGIATSKVETGIQQKSKDSISLSVIS